MTRVVHLSVVHKPDDPRIYERECRTLAQAGYEVMYLVPGAEPGRDDTGVILAPLPERATAAAAAPPAAHSRDRGETAPPPACRQRRAAAAPAALQSR